jgi:hypothetical protein
MDSNESISNKARAESRDAQAAAGYPTYPNDWAAQEAFKAWIDTGYAPYILSVPGMTPSVQGAFRDVCMAGFCAGRDSLSAPKKRIGEEPKA